MAVESSLSPELISKNREKSEPKKKLKKTRSIRLSKAPSLKPSYRRSRSRFDWLSVDITSDDASSVVEFSDSMPNDMKSSNSSDAKKDSSQGGSEFDDVTSVESSSYRSSVLANLNQSRMQKMLKTYGVSRSLRRRAKSRVEQAAAISSKDAAIPQRLLSAEVADGSPNYLKATSSSEGRKASYRSSLSAHASSDQYSSRISTPKSVSLKSSQTLARTPSMRTVRIIMNKTSFKPKRSSLRSSHISEDLNVERATCSSTFKDKKFPEHVELHSDREVAERISIMRVCPYQHCSLHGHSNDAAPAPKRSLHKKRKSQKPQETMRPESKSTPASKVSGEKKQQELSKLSSELESPGQELGLSSAGFTPLEKDKDVSFSIEIHAKIKAQFPRKADDGIGHSEASEITLGESSCHLESQKENLNQMMSSLIKSLSDLKEKSVGCCCNTEVHKASLVSREANSEVCEVGASNSGEKDHNITIDDQNQNLPFENLPDLHTNPDGHKNEAEFNDVSEESNRSILAENSDCATVDQRTICTVADQHSSEQNNTSTEMKNSNSESDGILVAEITQAGDTEAKKSVPSGDPKPSVSQHEDHPHRPKFSKDRQISMWHLIQQHMVSGLASDVDTKPLPKEDEQMHVDKTGAFTAIQTSVDKEEQGEESQSKDAINQDEELRRVLAIKLVREAIEKILLPEVPDQSSDDQSITSETTTEQDMSENNHAEESSESKSESNDEVEEDNNSRNSKELGPDSGSIDGIEQVKRDKKLEHKSEKKAPKHWSNLKKWIVLQRFIKALEKLKKINPREPRHLQVEPDSEGEKVVLRHQTVEERKNAEEWMLDYSLRQAISQLAPSQKKKVSLLVKAFETVVPPQEVSDIHAAFSRLKETSNESPSTTKKLDESLPEGSDPKQAETPPPAPNVQDRNSSAENQETNFRAPIIDESQLVINPSSSPNEDSSGAISTPSFSRKDSSSILGELASLSDLSPYYAEKNMQQGDEDVKEREFNHPHGLNPIEPRYNHNENEEDKKNYIRMWHNVYQHVVSSIVEKVGPKLLDGQDDEDAEDVDELPQFLETKQDAGHEKYPMAAWNGISRSEAVKLVQEAVNEILVPGIQDDMSETISVTSDMIPDEELSDKSHLEVEQRNNLNSTEGMKDEMGEIGDSKSEISSERPVNMSKVDVTVTLEERAKLLEQKVFEPPKPKNWSKLKKLMLLKRSIKALEKARKLKSQPQNVTLLMADQQPEVVDLKRQMMDERKKAEQWMLDYAVQNIVNQLTPARKRRVSMLVEAFEAVVPLPEM